MKKIIFHLDNDSYFAAAHVAVDPSLKGKPIAISTNRKRSIVTAASYEAKKRGVKVAMPLYLAKKACPDLYVVEPNFNLYTVLSTKLFEFIASTFTNKIEVASIDECYIDVTDIWKKYISPRNLALTMQKKILKELGLSVSIGVSTNKFVAKMSTSINKPFGITITKPSDFLKVFGDWKVEKYHGIGKPTAEKLNNIKIFTINDLANADLNKLKKITGKISENLIKQANGNGDNELDFGHNELKGISNSVTVLEGSKKFRYDILKTLKELCEKVAHRGKNRNLVGYVVAIGIKEAVRGKTNAKSIQKTLTVPIVESGDIFKVATELFDRIWKEEELKFLSVSLNKLENIFKITYQSSLFEKQKPLNKVENILNKVNQKFTKKVVITGQEGLLNKVKKQNQSRYIENDRIIKHLDDDF